MRGGLAEFERRGARLLAVGQGSEAEVVRYCTPFARDLTCLGDPEHAGYRALALKRGSWWTTVVKPFFTDPGESVRLVRNADLAASRLAASDVLQLGGVAIVDRTGTLRFLHVAETTADIPSNAEICAALDELAA